MERAGALISRLQEQYQQNAGADKMLVTLHILAAELELEKNRMVQNPKMVSVVTPSFANTRQAAEETTFVPVVKPAPPVAAEVKQKSVEAAIVETTAPQKITKPVEYDLLMEIPTLAAQKQQKHTPELNEIIGRNEESLNDRLKTGNIELGAVLQASPVKDLKRAIGINDRYVFLNELFRGDEQMYERSIKTINTFTIFAEAEFWIKRELKLKLGWNDNSEAVIQFDQLVRRRFS